MTNKSNREVAGENTPTFPSRWRGKFRAADRKNEPKYEDLAKKCIE